MPNLECRKCGFKVKKESVPSRCPYCGQSDSISDAKTAQDLIEETMFETGFFRRT